MMTSEGIRTRMNMIFGPVKTLRRNTEHPQTMKKNAVLHQPVQITIERHHGRRGTDEERRLSAPQKLKVCSAIKLSYVRDL